MSAHFGLICMKGNHLEGIPDLIKQLGWVYINKEEIPSYHSALKRWNEIYAKYDESFINAYVITQKNGWTIFFDPFLEGCLDEELLVSLSQTNQTEILSTCTEGSSGTYGFIFLQNGNAVRNFLSVEGNVEVNDGTPLEQEKGFNISGSVFEDDIWGILNKMGIDYDEMLGSTNQPSQIFFCELPLEELDKLKKSTEQKKQAAANKKPKWKFW